MDNKRKMKLFEDLDFRKVIIDLTDKQFSLKKKHDDTDVPLLCKLLITRARQGATLSMILFDLGIPNSKWIPFYKRNKKIRITVQDAIQYHKAYGQRQLLDMANAKRPHSPIMAKIMMANFYDIKEEYIEYASAKNANGGISEYRVVTTLTATDQVVEAVKPEEE